MWISVFCAALLLFKLFKKMFSSLSSISPFLNEKWDLELQIFLFSRTKTKAVVKRCSIKNVAWKNSQNS